MRFIRTDMPVYGVRCAVCVTWMPSLWAGQVGQAGDRQAGVEEVLLVHR